MRRQRKKSLYLTFQSFDHRKIVNRQFTSHVDLTISTFYDLYFLSLIYLLEKLCSNQKQFLILKMDEKLTLIDKKSEFER